MPNEAVVLVVVLAVAAALAVAVALVQRRQLRGLRAAPLATTSDSPPDAPDVMQVADLAEVGLLRIDREGLIQQANGAAHQFLERAAGDLVGRTALEAFLDHRASDLLMEVRRDGEARREIALGGEPQRTLLLVGTRGDRRADTWIVLQDLSELRRLQRIRTEFIDNLAHELRTPLTNVRLLTETLALEIERTGDQTPAQVAESVTRIDVETGHLVQMVNELLDLARIEQGGGTQRRDEVDLGRVTESVVDRLRLYADRQEVVLRGEMPAAATERTVTGDEERLEQMLLNLVQNAVKFSTPGTDVVVRVRAEPDSVVLEVEDHGPGIPRRDLERIFERFYKVDRARTRGRPGGTGLGLSIARHIAEAHGGRIWAESDEGEGARFFVELPKT